MTALPPLYPGAFHVTVIEVPLTTGVVEIVGVTGTLNGLTAALDALGADEPPMFVATTLKA